MRRGTSGAHGGRPRGSPPTGLYGTHADLYDALYSFKDYRAEAREVRRLAARHAERPGHSLLDVACGTGGHLAHLSRWYQCSGVDLSAAMLRVARRRLPQIRLFRGSMEGFRLRGEFDIVTCLFSSLGYLPTARRRRRAIANMARHLAPGGVLLVEPWLTPTSFRVPHLSVQVAEQPDLKVVRLTSSRRDGPFSVLEMLYAHVRLGHRPESFRETHRLLLAYPREHLSDLRAAGLRASWLAGGLTGRGIAIGVKPLEAARRKPRRAAVAPEHRGTP